MEAIDALRMEPYAVMPMQFHAARTTCPEEWLMLAVLDDALEIHRKHARLPGRKWRRLVSETEQWLFSDDTAWPFSFVNVCHVLGIDVDWLRLQLAEGPGTATTAKAPIETLPLAS